MVDHPNPWRLLKILVLRICLLILTLNVSFSRAEDGADAGLAASAPPGAVKAPGSIEVDRSNNFSRSADETHSMFERNILEQVVRLDNFFGNIKTENQLKSEYQLRWRNSLRVEKNTQLGFGTSLRANLQLPRINERLHLVISGENEGDRFSSSLPQDPGSSGFDRNTPSTHLVNSELRFDVIKNPSLNIFIGAGVLFIIPPETFMRTRFQYNYKINDLTLLRCGETLFVKRFDVLGETSEFDLERLLNSNTHLRWANAATISYEIKGIEWGTELYLIRELSPRSAITLMGGAYGNTSSEGAVGSYRVLSRYRRNFLRSWLFYEVEPEVSWLRSSDGHSPPSFALTMRLEVVFQGKEK